MENIENLSEAELQVVITNAQRALYERQTSKRKDGLAQIKAIAADIGVAVEIIEQGQSGSAKGGARGNAKGGKVAIKYRDASDPSHVWTGRGMAPRWIKEAEAAGRSRDQYLVQ